MGGERLEQPTMILQPAPSHNSKWCVVMVDAKRWERAWLAIVAWPIEPANRRTNRHEPVVTFSNVARSELDLHRGIELDP